jgi:hypothetical protein
LSESSPNKYFMEYAENIYEVVDEWIDLRSWRCIYEGERNIGQLDRLADIECYLCDFNQHWSRSSTD